MLVMSGDQLVISSPITYAVIALRLGGIGLQVRIVLAGLIVCPRGCGTDVTRDRCR
jgi:hypothetical protein